jgi:tetratricopeptide (TPR) repeat protein
MPEVAAEPVATRAPDAAHAKRSNAEGVRFLSWGKNDDALKAFEEAITADSSHVLAHYNAACAAARLGRFELAARELRRLARSTDPVALNALAKAHGDSDLEPAMLYPGVRAAIRAPAIATLDVKALVFEHSGRWNAWGENLTFKPDGRVYRKSEVHGMRTSPSYIDTDVGTWTASGSDFVIAPNKVWPSGARVTFGLCRIADTEQTPSPVGACLQVRELARERADATDYLPGHRKLAVE